MSKTNKVQDDLIKKEAKLENKLLNGESKFGEMLGEPRSFMGPPKIPDFIKGVGNFDFKGGLMKEA